MDYQKMYYILFDAIKDSLNAMHNEYYPKYTFTLNAIKDALNEMEQLELNEAIAMLKNGHLKTEDMNIESEPESDETDL